MSKKANPDTLNEEVLTLDVVDAPSHVEWTHIREALTPYGTYLSHTLFNLCTNISGNTVTTWRFTLAMSGSKTSETQCDMMQAAVDGMTIATPRPSWKLHLRFYPFDLDWKKPIDVLPIFIPRKSDASPVPTRVQRYYELEPYGRLASVEVNVDMGFPSRGDVVYFCDDASAKAALKDLQTANDALQPKIFDSMRLYCTAFDSHIDLTTVKEFFSQYGQISKCRRIRPGSHVLIGFQTKEAALEAVLAFSTSNHGSTLGFGTVIKFCEPKDLRIVSQADMQNSDAASEERKRRQEEDEPRLKQEEERRIAEDARLGEQDRRLEEERLAQQEHLKKERLAQEARRADEEYQLEKKRRAQAVVESEPAKASPTVQDEGLNNGPIRLSFKARLEQMAPFRQGFNSPMRDAMQSCQAATIRCADASAALTGAQTQEEEVRGRRLESAWKVALATAAFEEAQRVREAAERREAAAKGVLDAATQGLTADTTALEQGRAITRDALSQLYAAQQEEFEAQISFMPFGVVQQSLHVDGLPSEDGDVGPPPLDPDGAPNEPQQPFKQETPPTPSKEAMPVDAQGSVESDDDIPSDESRLAESIRKVEEMRQQEERDRQAKQAAAELRLIQEEQERAIRENKEREDRERLARKEEVRKREERERLERERVAQERAAASRRAQELQQQQQRTKKWKKASNIEGDRCRIRDRRICATKAVSSWLIAQERFQVVCDEFDTTTFSEQQPLVFENVPWPVLHRPDSLKVSSIDWSAVEAFFRQFRAQLPLFVYKDVVEKTLRRFHPDRWSSRGILATVFDEAMREKIREAGNVVSQAITPIWRESQALSENSSTEWY